MVRVILQGAKRRVFLFQDVAYLSRRYEDFFQNTQPEVRMRPLEISSQLKDEH